jgi:hypothetical protein
MGFFIIVILPVILSLTANRISQRLLPLVPILEFVAVKFYNCFIYTARGAGFDQLWLVIGPTISIIIALLLMIYKKQNIIKITVTIVSFLLMLILLDYSLKIFHRDMLIWILPFYLGVIALSFQKDRIKNN